MGYKDSKKYKKDLHQQAYDRLTGMQAFGQSKKEAMLDGTYKDKIFSFSTYKTYWQNCKYFIAFVQKEHPEVSNLKQARPYVGEWLQSCIDNCNSAWTVQTKAKAVGKLLGISTKDPDYFTPPQRRREDIIRSRVERSRDKHFSEANNDELIRFCKGTGGRREGISKLCGKDLVSKEQIVAEVERLAAKKHLSDDEKKIMKMNKDAMLFSDCEFFVRFVEKNGRERISPIVGPDVDSIVARFKATKPDEKVWLHVHSSADIHSYRAEYSNRVYRKYARRIEDIPFDGFHPGLGRKYQTEVYHCRKDESGRALDKAAMKMASIALGHNRIEIVANNYLRGL